MSEAVELVPERSPEADWWERKSLPIGEVSFPKRTIELVVIPYNAPTIVGWEGRRVEETISPGAFDGIERRANRIRANRDHDPGRTFGRALTFHPSRTEGLVAEVRVARTPLGEETLALCDEECLSGSAGFLPKDGLKGMIWENRSSYRIDKAWLGHIALVPEPAYEEARVLAVRSAQRSSASKTPLLDEWLALVREDELRSRSALMDR